MTLIVSPLHIFTKTEVYFSPIDKPTTKLLELIKNSKKRIHAAIYMLTAKPIAQALADAAKKVDVQIIVDKISYESAFGKGKMLQEAGINLWVYQASEKDQLAAANNRYGSFLPLMHNKFAIIDEKVWTGSFNWTQAANNKNCENVILTDDPVVCKRYLNHFQDLKKKCTRAQHVSQPIRGYYDTVKELFQQFLGTVKKKK